MAKKKPKNRGRQPRRRLEERARRDVELSLDPILDELARQERALTPLYGAVSQQMAPLGPQYQADLSKIQQDYLSGVEALKGYLGGTAGQSLGGAAAQEAPAAAGAFGAIGAGGLERLASQGVRNAGYQASTMRQLGLQHEAAGAELGRQRQDVYSDVGERIRQRMDELRDRQLQEQQIRQGMMSEKAFNQFLQQQLGIYLGPGGGMGHGKGKGRGKRKKKPTMTPGGTGGGP